MEQLIGLCRCARTPPGKVRREVTGADGKDIRITIRKVIEPGADEIVASSPTYPMKVGRDERRAALVCGAHGADLRSAVIYINDDTSNVGARPAANTPG
jgi:hypothetical protein